MKHKLICILYLALLLVAISSFVIMNSDLAKIRRERWLHHASKKNKQQQDDDKQISPALNTQSWLEDLNADNEAKENNVNAPNDVKISRNSDRKKSSQPVVECIDLTVSDDDDDDDDVVVVVTKTNSRSKPTQKRKSPPTASIERNDYKPSASIARKPAESSMMPKFSICSYNIWFGEPHPSERMKRISEIISELELRPTFLGLQEVTPGLLSVLRPLLMSLGYQVIAQEGVAYGCALAILTSGTSSASATPIATVIRSGFMDYSVSQMARGLLWARVDVKNVGEMLFSTTHLESFVSDNDGARERELQIKEATDFCAKSMNANGLKCCVITGDLNWDDERKRSKGLDKSLLSVVNDHNYVSGEGRKWIDAWLHSRPGQDGYTYDSKENPMLKGNLRRRFDRCLYISSVDDGVGIHSTDLVGTKAIDGLHWRKAVQKWAYGKPTGEISSYQMRPLCPSDHFGLVVEFGPAASAPKCIPKTGTKPKKRKK